MSDIPMTVNSNEETVQMEISNVINAGGGGGTTNYNLLTNKPKINNVELSGNKNLDELGITAAIGTQVESYVETHKGELKGDKGDPGTPGENGYTPVKGVDYFDGAPGAAGKDGAPGKDGAAGKDGQPGQDGYTPVKGVDYFDGQPGADGKDGENGEDGQNYHVDVISAAGTEVELQANKMIVLEEVAELYISLGDPIPGDVLSEYMFSFISGETATDFSYDVSAITFIDEPDIQANTIYQGSVVDGIAIMVGLTYE